MVELLPTIGSKTLWLDRLPWTRAGRTWTWVGEEMSHYMMTVDKSAGEQRENSIDPHMHLVQIPKMWGQKSEWAGEALAGHVVSARSRGKHTICLPCSKPVLQLLMNRFNLHNILWNRFMLPKKNNHGDPWSCLKFSCLEVVRPGLWPKSLTLEYFVYGKTQRQKWSWPTTSDSAKQWAQWDSVDSLGSLG